MRIDAMAAEVKAVSLLPGGALPAELLVDLAAKAVDAGLLGPGNRVECFKEAQAQLLAQCATGHVETHFLRHCSLVHAYRSQLSRPSSDWIGEERCFGLPAADV